MNWSWKIGTLAGIELRIHFTFLALPALIAAGAWLRGGGPAVLSEVGFLLAVFGCVLLHELGHALAARKYGIPTRDITLLPIGGVARLERMPEQPRQELWVALAGPAVNVAIAVILYGLLIVTGGPASVDLTAASAPIGVRLLLANIGLVLFNLIPAFPMDGGRILRAALASRMEYARATRIAAGIGQALAVALGVAGLFGNPMLLFVAVFVWIGAAGESRAVQTNSALAGVPVRAAMLSDFRCLDARETLGDAARLVIQGSQQDFPVTDRGRLVGVLTRADLVTALEQHGPALAVAVAARREFPCSDGSEALDAALGRLESSDVPTMPVLDSGRLIGLLTLENVGEYLLIQAATRKRLTGSNSPGLFAGRSAGDAV